MKVFEETKRQGVLKGKGGSYGNVIRTGLMLNAAKGTVDQLIGAAELRVVMRIIVLSLTIICWVVLAAAQVPEQAKVIAGAEQAVERAAKSSPTAGPGCVVGVSLDGRSVFEKAFGLAEIEHNVPLTPDSILESGSVAKQFTAASIVLLSLDGKLSLDDPVRKYIPELQDYGSPLTIRHLLNHTGGVRDWGTVLELTGYGRGDRVVSQALALDVITHQKALDFTPGAEYSYSNSGYTLLSTIVERVSKQSLPAFTQERFFKPLGMTHTGWRDDYQRLVTGRAQAYQGPVAGPWRLDMPFMNVYGNGGMLTTVGDWLKWNAMLDSRSMGAPLVDALENVGVLNDGRKITYALGLFVTKVNGFRQVSHSGSTAGYQTDLARYPDLKLSTAVLCNGSSKNPTAIARDIFNEIMGPFPPPAQPEAIETKPEDLQKYVGLWRDEKTHFPIRTAVENGVLRAPAGPLRPRRDGSFQVGPARFTFAFGKDGRPVSVERDIEGTVTRLIAETEWKPTADELNAFAGTWHSDEADATFTLIVENGQGFLTQRPNARVPLIPSYKDSFMVSLLPAVIWFTRDNGKLTMHVGMSRMRDMPFVKI